MRSLAGGSPRPFPIRIRRQVRIGQRPVGRVVEAARAGPIEMEAPAGAAGRVARGVTGRCSCRLRSGQVRLQMCGQMLQNSATLCACWVSAGVDERVENSEAAMSCSNRAAVPSWCFPRCGSRCFTSTNTMCFSTGHPNGYVGKELAAVAIKSPGSARRSLPLLKTVQFLVLIPLLQQRRSPARALCFD